MTSFPLILASNNGSAKLDDVMRSVVRPLMFTCDKTIIKKYRPSKEGSYCYRTELMNLI